MYACPWLSAPDPGSGVRPSPHSTLAATTIVTPCAKRDRDFARDRRVTVWASDGVCCPANLVLFAAEAHRRGRTVEHAARPEHAGLAALRIVDIPSLSFVSWISRPPRKYRAPAPLGAGPGVTRRCPRRPDETQGQDGHAAPGSRSSAARETPPRHREIHSRTRPSGYLDRWRVAHRPTFCSSSLAPSST